MWCNLLISMTLIQNNAMFNNLGERIILFLLLFLILLLLIGYALSHRNNKVLQGENEDIKDHLDKLQISNDCLNEQKDELEQSFEEVKQSEEKVRKLAYMDSLTQLPNKDSIMEQITNVMTTLRAEEHIALMYIDVDNLKEINDTLGYTYGDELLIDITYRIKQVLTEDDSMARISGDEFVIVTQNIEELTEYEEKLKKILTVFNFPFSLAEKDCFITVSIGICRFDKEMKNAGNILKNANAAMYKAKEMGKNQYCYFDEEIKQGLMEQIQKQTEVRQAFEDDAFFYVYQPVLNMSEHRILGFEALLRLEQEETVVKPRDFLAAAIESGVIVPLGLSMFKKACYAFVEWEKAGYHDLQLFINLSARQLIDYDVIGDLELILDQTKVDRKKIVFDIAEDAFVENESLLHQRVNELKALEVQVCLDEFGRTIGSLRHVLTTSYEYIKLDRSFLYDLERKPDLSSLLKGLDQQLICEGIEESEQLEVVEKHKMPLVQGFLFGAPVKEEEVLSYLQTWMN